jgi:hypothetical protein
LAGVNCQANEAGYLVEVNCRVVPPEQPFEMLEPYEGKLSRTVLRREWGGNAPDLSGASLMSKKKVNKYSEEIRRN